MNSLKISTPYHLTTSAVVPEQISPYPAQGPRGSSSHEADRRPPMQPQVL